MHPKYWEQREDFVEQVAEALEQDRCSVSCSRSARTMSHNSSRCGPVPSHVRFRLERLGSGRCGQGGRRSCREDRTTPSTQASRNARSRPAYTPCRCRRRQPDGSRRRIRRARPASGRLPQPVGELPADNDEITREQSTPSETSTRCSGASMTKASAQQPGRRGFLRNASANGSRKLHHVGRDAKHDLPDNRVNGRDAECRDRRAREPASHPW